MTYQGNSGGDEAGVVYVGGCGGLGGVCCESANAVTTETFRNVGPGRGSYDKAQTYNFVGLGAGSFEKEITTTYHGWKCRKCTIGVLTILVLGCVVYFLTTIANEPDTQAPQAPATMPATAVQASMQVTPAASTASPSAQYDCNDGFENWQYNWPMEKKIVCCATVGRACIGPVA
mmetsp:Transcript_95671/g.205268  ORF Transcript_95671/g.205268 Transcript_95671/m.205268 type:complete len:175 (-) Transcript_95671:228-752(-)